MSFCSPGGGWGGGEGSEFQHALGLGVYSSMHLGKETDVYPSMHLGRRDVCLGVSAGGVSAGGVSAGGGCLLEGVFAVGVSAGDGVCWRECLT